MGSVSGVLGMLSAREMERIHDSALKILEKTGMWVDSENARMYYRAAGCVVNEATKSVKFPRAVVENAVALMRNRFADGSDGDVWARVRYSRTCFTNVPYHAHPDFTANAGGFPTFILGLDGVRRDATMKDVIDSIRLADALPNIDMMGLPCSAQDVPHQERPIRMTAELLKRTNKIGGIEAFTVRDIHAIAEMSDVITGSRAESLRRPAVMGYAETRTPLCFDGNMAEIFIEYAKLGFPQSLDCMPCAGASSPVTAAGTIALGIAESLSGVVLGFAVNPAVRMGLVINPSAMDMRTMTFPYASANRMTITAAMVQMLHGFYGCPTGVHSGKTDACASNVQAGFEKALSAFIPIAFGAIGIGTLGNMEAGGLTYSHLQLVIDNEIVGYIRKIMRGIEVTDETLALEVIDEVGAGGNYIDHEHTVEHLRSEYFDSDITERLAWDAWKASDLRGIEAKATEKAKKIIATHDPHPLSLEQELEIDKIVKSYLG